LFLKKKPVLANGLFYYYKETITYCFSSASIPLQQAAAFEVILGI